MAHPIDQATFDGALSKKWTIKAQTLHGGTKWWEKDVSPLGLSNGEELTLLRTKEGGVDILRKDESYYSDPENPLEFVPRSEGLHGVINLTIDGVEHPHHLRVIYLGIEDQKNSIVGVLSTRYKHPGGSWHADD